MRKSRAVPALPSSYGGRCHPTGSASTSSGAGVKVAPTYRRLLFHDGSCRVAAQLHGFGTGQVGEVRPVAHGTRTAPQRRLLPGMRAIGGLVSRDRHGSPRRPHSANRVRVMPHMDWRRGKLTGLRQLYPPPPFSAAAHGIRRCGTPLFASRDRGWNQTRSRVAMPVPLCVPAFFRENGN